MFGFVVANTGELTPEEKERYQRVYCGLCRTLGRRSGQLSRLSLTYDMTFLILMLSSLYEPAETAGTLRCPVHPAKAHPYTVSALSDYAADMTVALSYYKCLDDWADERKPAARGYAALLKRRYAGVRGQWPRQCGTIERELAELTRAETEKAPLDALANCFGVLMGEVFAYREDEWERPLRRFGRELGKFIYVMDAAVDYEKDVEKGRYNPLLEMKKTPEEMREPMTVLLGQAAGVFEKMPLVQDARLLRNVLYAGVWQKYNVEKKGGKGADHDSRPL